MSATPSAEDSSIVDFNVKVGPWVVFAPQGDLLFEGKLARFADQGGIVRRLEGRAMTSPGELYREFALKMSFPSYFGHNWDALIDCLDDLHGDWHGNRDVVIVIKDFDVLGDTPHMPKFVSVLCQAAEKANSVFDDDGEPFHRQAIALHFLLETEKAGLAELSAKLTSAEYATSMRHGYLVLE
ncbi:MAG TPA: barstar family protein [Candidatus Limnocylindria bacterium]|nr:barstar family protein [Candidatus Limnocylindria bacterium]